MRQALLVLVTASVALAACNSPKSRPKGEPEDESDARSRSSAPQDDVSRLRTHLAEVAATTTPRVVESVAATPPTPPPPRSMRYGVKGPADSPDPHVAREQALREAREFGMIGGDPGLGSVGSLSGSPGRLSSGRSKPPQVRMGGTSVSGKLPAEVIQRIVRQNFGRLRLCYENGLRTDPSLSGRVEVAFTIDKDGAVSGVGSGGGTTLPDSAVVSCVTKAFGGLSFPAPESGVVKVTYPINFSPGDVKLNGKALDAVDVTDVSDALRAAGCTDIVDRSGPPTTFTAKKDGRAFTITFVGARDGALPTAAREALEASGAVRTDGTSSNFVLAVVDDAGDKTIAQKLLEALIVSA